MTVGPLPQITVSGGPFERGHQHGAQVGELIARHLSLLIESLCRSHSGGVTLTRQQLLARALDFLPLYEDYAPDLVEELRGVAAGARLDLAEVLLLNVRGEMLGRTNEGCTAFAVGRSLTADGGVLAGQNSDQAAWNEEVLIVLVARPESGPTVLMCTHAGLIGYHGCNTAGVGQFANAVPSTGRRLGIPHYLMKRRLLAQTSVADCLEILRKAQVTSCGNYVLAERSGRLLSAELTTVGVETIAPDGDLIVHANHYEHPSLQTYNGDMSQHVGSVGRSERLRRLIRAQAGRVTLETMKAALADRCGEPVPIFRQENPKERTVASMIAELDQGRLHVRRGSAAADKYHVYAAP